MKETEILFLGDKSVFFFPVFDFFKIRLSETFSRAPKNVGLLGEHLLEGNKHLIGAERLD